MKVSVIPVRDLEARLGLDVHLAIARSRETLPTDGAAVGPAVDMGAEMGLEVSKLSRCFAADVALNELVSAASCSATGVFGDRIVAFDIIIILELALLVDDSRGFERLGCLRYLDKWVGEAL